MSTIRENFVTGAVQENPLSAVAVLLTMAGRLQALPTVVAPDIARLTIDPDGTDVLVGSGREIVHVTAYVEGDPTATILRGQEGTTQKPHSQGVKIVHADTVDDWSEKANLTGADFTGPVSAPSVTSPALHSSGTLVVDGATTMAAATASSLHSTGTLVVDGLSTLKGAVVQSSAIGNVPLTVRGIAGQTAALLNVTDPTAATSFASMTAAGVLQLNAGMIALPVAVGSVAAIVRGLGGQTADLFQAQDSTTTALLAIGSAGQLRSLSTLFANYNTGNQVKVGTVGAGAAAGLEIGTDGRTWLGNPAADLLSFNVGGAQRVWLDWRTGGDSAVKILSGGQLIVEGASNRRFRVLNDATWTYIVGEDNAGTSSNGNLYIQSGSIYSKLMNSAGEYRWYNAGGTYLAGLDAGGGFHAIGTGKFGSGAITASGTLAYISLSDYFGDQALVAARGTAGHLVQLTLQPQGGSFINLQDGSGNNKLRIDGGGTPTNATALILEANVGGVNNQYRIVVGAALGALTAGVPAGGKILYIS